MRINVDGEIWKVTAEMLSPIIGKIGTQGAQAVIEFAGSVIRNLSMEPDDSM